jgi:hypothetical protein
LLGVLVGYQLNMANLESSQRAADGQAESWDMYSCSILAISDCLNLMLELPWLMTRNPYQPQNESRRGIWIQTVPQVYYNFRPNYQWMMTPMEIHISHQLWGPFRWAPWMKPSHVKAQFSTTPMTKSSRKSFCSHWPRRSDMYRKNSELKGNICQRDVWPVIKRGNGKSSIYR